MFCWETPSIAEFFEDAVEEINNTPTDDNDQKRDQKRSVLTE